MIILHCTKCAQAQSALEVATNKVHPETCLRCGGDEFLVSAESALKLYKLEEAVKSFAMILDGAYS